MNMIKLICFVAFVAVFGSGVDAACGSTLSTYLTPQSDANTTRLYVQSPYPVAIISGDVLAVIWNGTDAGMVDNLVFADDISNLTLIDGTVTKPVAEPLSGRSPRPVVKVSTADRTKNALSICTFVLGLTALFCSRKGLSSSTTIFTTLFVLSIASLISSAVFDAAPCPDATVTLQIPEGTIQFICVNDEPCVCGPGYSGDNCDGASVPIATPISTPIPNPPVATPVAAPVAAPVNPPVNPPTNPPVKPPVAPTCSDAVQNGFETDVDCGGGTCPKCADTKKCGVANDCSSGVCTGNICQQPGCADSVKNGAETDVDCGGGTCPKCAATKKCTGGSDCSSGVCTGNICQQPGCADQVQNGAETDVDCGGGTCPKCAATKKCTGGSDCSSGVCTGNVCQQPSCADSVQNGAETDVDCGGGTCPKCAATKKCTGGSDCSSGVCTGNVCQQPSCADSVQNGAETDVDCGGGTCSKCADTKKCTSNNDCTSGNCQSNVCAAQTPCTNGVQDGEETDTDCGGSDCSACADGKTCVMNSDCTSGHCYNLDVEGTCAAIQCYDGTQNGSETDTDCGGPNTCPRCTGGKRCKVDSDCVEYFALFCNSVFQCEVL